MGLEIFTAVGYGAIAVLIAVLAAYLAIKLLGKIAKYVIIGVVVAFVLWFLFSDHSILQMMSGLGDKLPSFAELFGKGA